MSCVGLHIGRLMASCGAPLVVSNQGESLLIRGHIYDDLFLSGSCSLFFQHNGHTISENQNNI